MSTKVGTVSGHTDRHGANAAPAAHCTRQGALRAPVRVSVAIVIGDKALELCGNERADRCPTSGCQHLGLPDHIVAFCVDNAKSLPIWRDLPHVAYWGLPTAIGVPLVVRSLIHYTNASNEHTR